MADTSPSVSFRLPAAFAKQLAAQAADHKMSIGEYARRLVVDALSDTRQELTHQELVGIRENMERLREDLATATGNLLVNAGKVPADQAERWVREHLLPPNGH